MEKRNPRMTRDEAEEFFSELYGGSHHIPGRKYKGENIKPFGAGWYVADYGATLATYDFNLLTRLVLLAHDRCVRVEIMPCNFQRVKIAIWKRAGRGSDICYSHPTIEAAVADWRRHHPIEEREGVTPSQSSKVVGG